MPRKGPLRGMGYCFSGRFAVTDSGVVDVLFTPSPKSIQEFVWSFRLADKCHRLRLLYHYHSHLVCFGSEHKFDFAPGSSFR